MGLIAAALGSAGGVLADQWREFFYCDSLDANIALVLNNARLAAKTAALL